VTVEGIEQPLVDLGDDLRQLVQHAERGIETQSVSPRQLVRTRRDEQASVVAGEQLQAITRAIENDVGAVVEESGLG
jgi:hypothetical protein